VKVTDIHTHVVLRRGFLDKNGETAATAAELVQIQDRCGVDRMVALPLASPEALHFQQSNEEVFEACDQFPGRFIKFCSVDPRIEYNSPEHDFVPILEYYKSCGARGLGELVANLWWDDPRVQQLLSACERVGFPVIFHVATREFRTYGLISEPGLGGLERALKKFPKLHLVGHSQAFWSEVGPVEESERGGYPSGKVLPGGAVPRLLREYPNLWGDLSAGSGFNAVSRDPEWGWRFLEEFQDRLCFGLDICRPSGETPLVDFMREAGATGKISRAAHEKIMGGNAARLLNLD
jgi:hypothetical protein